MFLLTTNVHFCSEEVDQLGVFLFSHVTGGAATVNRGFGKNCLRSNFLLSLYPLHFKGLTHPNNKKINK